MRDIKALINKIQKTIPKEDTMKIGDLVHKNEVSKELEELQLLKERWLPKIKLAERMSKYKRATDLINDFKLDATKRTVMEMEHGEKSADRLRAAENLLNRGMGKPVEKSVNVNIEIGNYQDNEVDDKIGQLMSELGYSKTRGRKLIIDAEATEIKE